VSQKGVPKLDEIMGIKFLFRLHQNRYGIFCFRGAIFPWTRSDFSQREIYLFRKKGFGKKSVNDGRKLSSNTRRPVTPL